MTKCGKKIRKSHDSATIVDIEACQHTKNNQEKLESRQCIENSFLNFKTRSRINEERLILSSVSTSYIAS